jgi:hypothetical protein
MLRTANSNMAAAMRYVLAAAILAVLAATPALAQFSGGQDKQKTPLDLKYEKEENDQKENERAYNDQMKRLKAQQPTSASSDPWKTFRPAGDSSTKR